MKYILPLLLFCVPAQAEVVREMSDLITKDNVNGTVSVNGDTTIDGTISATGAGSFGQTGNMGNGTHLLKVTGSGLNSSSRIQTAGTGYQGYLAFDRARGTIAAPTALQANDIFGSVIGVGAFDGTNVYGHGPEMRFLAHQNWSPTAYGSDIRFLSPRDNSTTQANTMTMRGEVVGINTTVLQSISAAYGRLHVNGSTAGMLTLTVNDTIVGTFNGLATALQINAVGAAIPMTFDVNGAERVRISTAGFVGVANASPASTLQIGTSLDATTSYMQIDTLAADTAGPPAATDCDAATEVGRMVASSRYTATADNSLWVCLQTAASTYAWWRAALNAP